MRTQYRTDIGCCKAFMPRLNDTYGDCQPVVGDIVVVSNCVHTPKIVELRGVSRTWGADVLEIEPHLGGFWAERGITASTKFVEGK